MGCSRTIAPVWEKFDLYQKASVFHQIESHFVKTRFVKTRIVAQVIFLNTVIVSCGLQRRFCRQIFWLLYKFKPKTNKEDYA